MPLRSNARFVAVVTLLAAAPALLAAQPAQTGSAGTGGVDPNWSVSYAPKASGYSSAFGSAFGLERFSEGIRWIAPTASGTVPGGAADGMLDRFFYAFRTTFSGAGLASFTYRCAFDDLFDAVLLNGSAVAGGCGAYGLGSVQTLSGFGTGVNTLEFRTKGNGVTDGFAFTVTGTTALPTSAVPEPATWLLLASGLTALAGVGAIRRRVSA